MRGITLFVFLLSSSLTTYSQSSQLLIKVNGDKFYLDHKVVAKENWYSIGRIYEISPKEIAPFNSLTLEKGLGIGQILKIPLNASNFNQETETPIGKPVVHKVGPKEGLFRIASEFGVTVAQLKMWNKLNSDQVNAGAPIIVGFLKGNNIKPQEDGIVSTPAIVKEPAPSNIGAVKEEKKPTISNPLPKEAPKVEEKKADLPKPSAMVSASKEKVNSVALSGSGYFSSLFLQQSKEGKQQILDGFVYGVFKSTSGWDDSKYYVLLNDVVPGTAVKITVRGSDKSIYAKVLGSVPPGKESEGMSMRMSNATAAALGLADTSVDLGLVWFN
jgi:LysM repeat protein